MEPSRLPAATAVPGVVSTPIWTDWVIELRSATAGLLPLILGSDVPSPATLQVSALHLWVLVVQQGSLDLLPPCGEILRTVVHEGVDGRSGHGTVRLTVEVGVPGDFVLAATGEQRSARLGVFVGRQVLDCLGCGDLVFVEENGRWQEARTSRHGIRVDVGLKESFNGARIARVADEQDLRADGTVSLDNAGQDVVSDESLRIVVDRYECLVPAIGFLAVLVRNPRSMPGVGEDTDVVESCRYDEVGELTNDSIPCRSLIEQHSTLGTILGQQFVPVDGIVHAAPKRCLWVSIDTHAQVSPHKVPSLIQTCTDAVNTPEVTILDPSIHFRVLNDAVPVATERTIVHGDHCPRSVQQNVEPACDGSYVVP